MSLGPANPNRPLCDRCDGNDRDGALEEVSSGELLCPACVESRAERMQEMSDEAYYGGSEPTLVERRAL